MAPKLQNLASLIKEIDEFPIRDRKVQKMQAEMSRALTASGSIEALESAVVERYASTLKRYFSQFQSEAQSHVRELDRRLENLAQSQFNATAERGVAARRIELTKAVLSRLEEL